MNPSAGIEETTGYQSLQIGNVFPNPAQAVATVEIHSKNYSRLKTTLFSNTGEMVTIFPNKNICPGTQQLSLQFGILPTGVYYLFFEDGKEKIIRKVIVAR